MSCPIKVNSNTIERKVHTYCYWVLDLLCGKNGFQLTSTNLKKSAVHFFFIFRMTEANEKIRKILRKISTHVSSNSKRKNPLSQNLEIRRVKTRMSRLKKKSQLQNRFNFYMSNSFNSNIMVNHPAVVAWR